ncbi:hypothetical protein [Planomonospora parontospora]|uniref:hypothetical protein n=1 Tax=Planomonospora parontospora TaxID=58119 RepID=UPI0016715940|nr:hypothetical protein [Planomonospora parontospora]GGL54221.1 hypothetical protein GCM10014719_64430 [Planomonospora parontospora subsp. antibiotica]GII19713.1 hypothetical protein Ppa05_64390 [Planomonospora parontospora subsp. antibiotica]
MPDGYHGVPGGVLDGRHGSAAQATLPRREAALRCPQENAHRRCILPPGHVLDHVYPPRGLGAS